MITSIITFAIGACWAVDGDTIRCGQEKVRLRHIDSAEMHGPHRQLAQAAKDEMSMLIAGSRVICTVSRRDKYGRLLGDCKNDAGVSLSHDMLDKHLAVPYEGGHRVPY